MKSELNKKEYKACPAKLKRSGGFALLFSVLVSSLLLTIGLSIFSIALKELAISTATRQSVHAFYAADSGREYVKYKDTKIGDASTFDVSKKETQNVTNRIPENELINEVILVDENNSDGPNFYVNINKTWSDGTYTKINTVITSYGHDSISGDKVERAIFQSY